MQSRLLPRHSGNFLPSHRRYIYSLSLSVPHIRKNDTNLSRKTVWIKVGICSADSVINLALCCLGYLPGLFHAWYIIFKYPEPDFIDEPIIGGGDVEGNNRVTYYVFQPPPPPSSNSRNYGTLGGQSSSSSSPAPPARQQDDQEGAASGGGHPPTYAEAVRGDHKIQTHD